MTMKISVRYFASVRETIGASEEAVETAAATLAELRDELIGRGAPWSGALKRGRAVRMALDQVMSAESAVLHPGCEVAFFPPVTGG